MNKQPTTIRTYLLRGAFLLSLLCVIVMPLALGQRQISKGPSAPDVCPTPWQLVHDMPLDLYGAAGASDGTYSYHAGGYSFSSDTTLNSLYRYDPVANSWIGLAPMPDAVIMASAVYYPTTNKIYVFGGEYCDTGVNSNLTRIYDIAANFWSLGANMPDVRSFMASGYNSANGKIYLVSGYNTGQVTSAQPNTWEYDPVPDIWTDLTGTAPFPHPAGGFASGVINGHLYVAGGRDAANTVITLVWDYNIAANTWTQKTDMPAGNTNVPGSGVALDNLWVFGGGNPFGHAGHGSTKAAFARERVKGQPVPDTTNAAVRYDPGTDTWSSAPNMNVQRSFPSGTAIVAKLIAAGGFNGATTVASTEVLDACIPSPTPPQCDTGIIMNEGFETGSFPPWVIDGFNATPVVTNTRSHSGTFSAFAGDAPNGFCGFPGSETTGDSSFYQQFTVPAGTSTLSFWHFDCTTDSITFDWQDAYITDSSGTILQTIFHQCLNTRAWVNQTVDMTPYASQTVRIKFLVHEDGFGDLTGMYVDDVALLEPCPTPTPTPTPTATPTPTPTPGPITLSASGRKVGGVNTSRLTWSGATSTNVDVYRDGIVIATVPNTGLHTDSTGDTGRARYTYKVCAAGTQTCSNEATVTFRH